MALPSAIHKITIHLSYINREIYETVQATVARHPSETEERLIARLLAYAIFSGAGTGEQTLVTGSPAGV